MISTSLLFCLQLAVKASSMTQLTNDAATGADCKRLQACIYAKWLYFEQCECLCFCVQKKNQMISSFIRL